ncbi:MAG: hypothetical protein LBQ69_05940 [Treponema sp.]|nr:hypothetical protein [Treponema sp.]
MPCLPVALVCLVAACSPSGVDSIQRESLFSLEIGPMEDQLALYGFEGNAGGRRTGIAMRDGFFFITDSGSGKIVRYNSYGNLLFMIYNDETNPEPVSLKTRVDDSAQATRWAYTYPLQSPGKIAIDSRKHIFVEERLPHERQSFDTENHALLDSVVLHFDADGRFIEYIGQGGQGGGPYPNIAGLHASVHDEIAVVCRLPTGWDTYWYSADGEQLFLVQIRNNAIPIPPDWPDYTSFIESIMAAPDARKLYVKVDYYRNVYDESTNTRVSTEPASSLIWILNVEEGFYESSIDVPFYEYHLSETGKTTTVRLLYSMLGLVRGGGILLYFPIESGYAILSMDSGGHGQRRAFIDVDPGELRFNSFHLSSEGILSALLADEWRIRVAWWRMDKFLGDLP